MLESDILYTAIEYLEKADSLADWDCYAPKPQWLSLDACLTSGRGPAKAAFKVEVKENVLPSTLPRWVDRLKSTDLLVINAFPILQKNYWKSGALVLDTSGNCFIRNDNDIFWHIKGHGRIAKNGEISFGLSRKTASIWFMPCFWMKTCWTNDTVKLLL